MSQRRAPFLWVEKAADHTSCISGSSCSHINRLIEPQDAITLQYPVYALLHAEISMWA